jgi:hypothetical protein
LKRKNIVQKVTINVSTFGRKYIYILGHTRKGRETFKLEEKEYLV